jgi:hypothetical protein
MCEKGCIYDPNETRNIRKREKNQPPRNPQGPKSIPETSRERLIVRISLVDFCDFLEIIFEAEVTECAETDGDGERAEDE